MKCRTKQFVMVSYGTFQKAYVNIYPQQKWNILERDNSENIAIERNNVVIEIPNKDFDNLFIKLN